MSAGQRRGEGERWQALWRAFLAPVLGINCLLGRCPLWSPAESSQASGSVDLTSAASSLLRTGHFAGLCQGLNKTDPVTIAQGRQKKITLIQKNRKAPVRHKAQCLFLPPRA